MSEVTRTLASNSVSLDLHSAHLGDGGDHNSQHGQPVDEVRAPHVSQKRRGLILEEADGLRQWVVQRQPAVAQRDGDGVGLPPSSPSPTLLSCQRMERSGRTRSSLDRHVERTPLVTVLKVLTDALRAGTSARPASRSRARRERTAIPGRSAQQRRDRNRV